MVDFSIARGLDYYTGTVYETMLKEYPSLGSVCSGGRYENLAEYYTNKKLPGVGISIGLTRLFYVLNEYKLLNQDTPNAISSLQSVQPSTSEWSDDSSSEDESKKDDKSPIEELP